MKRTKAASDGKKVIFSFNNWPFAEEVFVAGTFNDWEFRRDPMKKTKKGWELAKYLHPGIYEYRFIVDGIWMDDPAAKIRCRNQYGGENCVLEV